MVELKCRAELAVTGRSACRNAECENSKERGGRIPQGKLRWGIGGPGGHSMKWYCIRPICLPADQVKDMLVPDKCENAAEMDGVSELPPGFREVTITCLEAIRDDKADQLDEEVLTRLDEVSPMMPTTPRAAARTTTELSPPSTTGGRQGLRRVRPRIKPGSSAGGDEGDEEEEPDSEDDDPGGMVRGGGGASSSPSPRTVAPPALLIPGRRDSGHGGSDSPVLAPPMKVLKLNEDIVGGSTVDASARGVESLSSHSSAAGHSISAVESYHPLELGLYPGGALGAPRSIEHVSASGVVGDMPIGAAASGPSVVAGSGATAAGGDEARPPLPYGTAGAGGVTVASPMVVKGTLEAAPDAGALEVEGFSPEIGIGGGSGGVSSSLQASSLGSHEGGLVNITQDPSSAEATGFNSTGVGSPLGPGLHVFSSALPYGESAATGLDALNTPTDAMGSHLISSADGMDSALQEIGDDLMVHDPSINASIGRLLSGGAAGEIVSSVGGGALVGVDATVSATPAGASSPDSLATGIVPTAIEGGLAAQSVDSMSGALPSSSPAEGGETGAEGGAGTVGGGLSSM